MLNVVRLFLYTFLRWISKDFNAVRKAYISLAKKAHLEKQSGGLRSATFPPSAAEAAASKIPNEMLQLLTLMHANPHDRYVVLMYVFFYYFCKLTYFYIFIFAFASVA